MAPLEQNLFKSISFSDFESFHVQGASSEPVSFAALAPSKCATSRCEGKNMMITC